MKSSAALNMTFTLCVHTYIHRLHTYELHVFNFALKTSLKKVKRMYFLFTISFYLFCTNNPIVFFVYIFVNFYEDVTTCINCLVHECSIIVNTHFKQI